MRTHWRGPNSSKVLLLTWSFLPHWWRDSDAVGSCMLIPFSHTFPSVGVQCKRRGCDDKNTVSAASRSEMTLWVLISSSGARTHPPIRTSLSI